MPSKWRIGFKVAAVACAVLASAAAGAAGTASTAEELAQIEAQHAVLKARLRVLETRAQMAAREADIQRYAPATEHGAPSVDSIEGVDGKLKATLMLDNGRFAEVAAGDVLPNGMKVVSIRPDGVVVQRPDKKRVRLQPAAQVREETGLPLAAEAAPQHPGASMTAMPMAPTSMAPAMPPMPHPGSTR
jgi:type IV pilus biogenesis protein PilP